MPSRHTSSADTHAMVGWTMYPKGAVKVTLGTPKVYESSKHGRRHFCPIVARDFFIPMQKYCRISLIFRVRPMTISGSVPARAHIQVADRIRWMERAHELPAFERYPPQE